MRIARFAALLCIVTSAAAHPLRSSTPDLRSVDAAGLKALRDQSKGNVLVINLWATWCTPCQEEFPGFVKLQKAYEGKGVDVVFVSIDDDDAKTKRKVIAFLKRMNVRSTSYIKKSGNDDTFIDAVNPKWSGALPATLVYDRRGTLTALKVEELSSTELEEIIKPLLTR